MNSSGVIAVAAAAAAVPGAAPAARSIRGPLLAFDTATTVAVVALGDAAGRLLAETSWTAGYRHGEELLARIDALLSSAGVELGALGGIVVGTGPGAFTGLRVGLATAKGLTHGLGIPIVGVATSTALLQGAADAEGPESPGSSEVGPLVLLLPAGPSDRILVAAGIPRLLVGDADPDIGIGARLVAVDLAGRAPADAVERGERARAGLAAALVRIGVERLAAGATDDLAALVPEYVTLPRGVHAEAGAVEWSRDPR
jgi:tRNA threonylcarbamoyl adenosine modification protein YeaZ